MRKIHESQFMKMELDGERNVLFQTYLEASQEMKDEEFCAEEIIFTEAVEKYKPKQILANLENFSFTIVPAIQQWMDEEMFPRYIKAGVEKIAFLVPHDIFAQVSVEQTMDESTAQKIESEYFENREEAINWLFS